jgi:glycosyltransferase involved in cell wall biosynthesis
MREEIERLVAQDPVDICVADFLVATANLPDRNGIPVVLFEHNVEHVVWQRLARLERRVAHRAALEIEWRKLRAYEADACATADLTIAVSEEDRRTLSALARGARTTSVPTGVDTEYFAPGGRREIPGRLVFTGSMDWHPNEDAVIHFSETILPLIRARARFARLPEISFTVVGRNPGPRLAALSRMGVTVTGTVPDVRPFIDEAALYVVPLRAGGGTRLKIFEALAMGKAVVSTSVGAEGLGLTADKEIVFADDPVAFADAVVSLLRDPPTRERLGHAGRALVESAYSWDHAVRTFEAHCESVIARRSLHHMRAQRVPPAVLNRRESI